MYNLHSDKLFSVHRVLNKKRKPKKDAGSMVAKLAQKLHAERQAAKRGI